MTRHQYIQRQVRKIPVEYGDFVLDKPLVWIAHASLPSKRQYFEAIT